MLLTYWSPVLLLVFISACLGFPLDRRQTNFTSLASCASAPLLVDQFTSFSGNANTYPHVTFFVTNPNLGAPGKMLCTATFPSNEGSFNGSKFYSCEQAGTSFNWHSGHLKVFQYQVCTSGVVNTVTRQILIVAQGDIAAISYPGEDGGEYSENITGSSIPIVDVQDVQSLNRGIGRSVDEQNAMCWDSTLEFPTEIVGKTKELQCPEQGGDTWQRHHQRKLYGWNQDPSSESEDRIQIKC